MVCKVLEQFSVTVTSSPWLCCVNYAGSAGIEDLAWRKSVFDRGIFDSEELNNTVLQIPLDLTQSRMI